MKLRHGGRLRAAASTYGIAMEEWLDFSTAINPQSWPIPAIPESVWQRLPEEDDGLQEAIHQFYGRSNGLAVPGTQAVIETLPTLFASRRVWVPAIGYQEHAFCWQKRGHRLHHYIELPTLSQLAHGDIVVVINPNNPTAELHSTLTLIDMARTLEALDGLLVVDEAFMDCTPEKSLLSTEASPAMLVLRSFGKFFGLAGIRLGFCFADAQLRERLDDALGPWAVNHPARWLAAQALRDKAWHLSARASLQAAREQMQGMLARELPDTVTQTATDLFITLHLGCVAATSMHDHLARQGILTRLFESEGLLRIGIDADEVNQKRLFDGLQYWKL